MLHGAWTIGPALGVDGCKTLMSRSGCDADGVKSSISTKIS